MISDVPRASAKDGRPAQDSGVPGRNPASCVIGWPVPARRRHHVSVTKPRTPFAVPVAAGLRAGRQHARVGGTAVAQLLSSSPKAGGDRDGYGIAVPIGAIGVLIAGLSARISLRVGAAAG